MKILTFTTLYPHKYEPTLGIFVENRLRHLVRDENVEAEVIAPVPWSPLGFRFLGAYGRAGASPRREERHGLNVDHPRFLVIPKIGMLSTPASLARAGLKAARKLIRKGYDFDLIDAHYLFPDGVAAVQIGAALDKPVVLTARGSDVTQITDIPAARKMILDACNRAAHINVVSRNLKNRLASIGVPDERMTIVRNGVDLDHFRERDRDRIRQELGVEGKLLLYAGWLIPRKRVDLVIKVTKELEDVKAVIIGDGPEKRSLKKLAKSLGIADRVVFLGQKTPEEMPSYFSAADLTLLLSTREGWANVLLESMACGTPVLASNAGAAPDLVSHPAAGFCVETTLPEQIAISANMLLQNLPDRKDVRRYAETFSWRETSHLQVRIFNDALSSYQKDKKER